MTITVLYKVWQNRTQEQTLQWPMHFTINDFCAALMFMFLTVTQYRTQNVAKGDVNWWSTYQFREIIYECPEKVRPQTLSYVEKNQF